jgi:hypothetical protein
MSSGFIVAATIDNFRTCPAKIVVTRSVIPRAGDVTVYW